MDYRAPLKKEDLDGAQTHKRSLIFLMLQLGKILSTFREQNAGLPDHIELPLSEIGRAFVKAIIAKSDRPDWFTKLFQLPDTNPLPFTHEKGVVIVLMSNANVPTAVEVQIRGITIDSRTSPPQEFDRELGKFETSESTAVNYGGALGDVVVAAAEEFRDHLHAHSHQEPDPFKFAADTLASISHIHEGMCLDMHMMSLIPASAWYLNSDWAKHHRLIRGLAERAGKGNPHRRQRRIHVVGPSLLKDAKELILMVDLFLHDLLHLVESRVFLVDAQYVGKPFGIPEVGGVLLMAYGIFSNSSGTYELIISDIPPFAVAAPDDFRVFSIPKGDIQALYYFIRHNWHNAWWGRIAKADLICTPDLIRRAIKLPDDAKIRGLPRLRFFRNLYDRTTASKDGEDSLFTEIKRILKQMLQQADIHGGNLDDGKFRNWFERNGIRQ